ncbi:hypothetical protein [Streptomyces bikiniensis]|uniref:hypothetical protein n=1 Tax=Streptomyces bikiniensis TaxID=1896 RepID=UPI0004C175A1|nr:hypothetical protein [Streptomyces bikiniensis]
MPAEHIPPGTAAWRHSEAERWLAAAPARWAHPLWTLPALIASLVWDIAEAPVAPCTSAAPCGTDWLGLGTAVVLLLTLYWVWRQPRLALAGLAATLTGFAVEGGYASALGEPSTLAFLMAAAFTTAGLVHRLAAAGRQRARALEAAGPVAQPLPAAARTFRRGRLSLVLAGLLLGVAGFGCWQVHQVVDAYEERAAEAAHLSGRVTALEQDDDIDIVEVEADGRTHRFETASPEDFPVGSRVDVVVDGDWAALVAEPYDAVGWELLAVAGSVAGLAFLANGVDGRRRSQRLRREPLPVLHVLVREDHDDGRTWVFAADDPEGLRPILHFHSLYAFEQEEDDEDGGAAPVVELDKITEVLKGEDPPPPLREAVLYGAPYAGAEVAFVAFDDEDDVEVSVQCSVTAVKPAGSGLMGRGQRPCDEIAAGMTPSAGPRTWTAHGSSRAVGLGLLLVQGGGIWAALEDGPSWHWLWLAVSLPWLVTAVATALTWRITADRDGLWVTGAWRVRRVPWNVITSVHHSADGIRVGRAEDSSVELSPTGWAWLEHRLGREPHAVRTAEELRVLLLHPELRPLEEAPVGRQGVPVGPPLAALSALWGVAVLLLL